MFVTLQFGCTLLIRKGMNFENERNENMKWKFYEFHIKILN